MLKQTLIAASLAVLLAGPAAAADQARRARADSDKEPTAAIHKQPAKAVPGKQPAAASRQPPAKPAPATFSAPPDKGKRGADWNHEPRYPHEASRRDDHDREHDRGHDRGDVRHDRDWRDDDRRHGHDRDRNDWRRDDDWRRQGWHYHGGGNDGWRYYRGYDNRHWRCVPPYRYSLDFGYRSGYELAWRDWMYYGRYDRYWRRGAYYGYGVGLSYHAGYDAGWRDAMYYFGLGYRPDYWSYDPHGGWYFSFRIQG